MTGFKLKLIVLGLSAALTIAIPVSGWNIVNGIRNAVEDTAYIKQRQNAMADTLGEVKAQLQRLENGKPKPSRPGRTGPNNGAGGVDSPTRINVPAGIESIGGTDSISGNDSGAGKQTIIEKQSVTVSENTTNDAARREKDIRTSKDQPPNPAVQANTCASGQAQFYRNDDR